MSDDEWLRVEELLHCPDNVAEYDAAAPRCGRTIRRAAANPPAAPPAGAAGLLSPLVAPTGFRHAAPAEVLSRRPGRGLPVGPRDRGTPQ